MKRMGMTLLVAGVLMGSGVGRMAGAQGTGATQAKDTMAGTWQGTLEAGRALRLVMKIERTDKGLTGTAYSIDQGGQKMGLSDVALDGTQFHFSVGLVNGTYKGTLSADGRTVTGVWQQGPNPLPLVLVRATAETAWAIPAPPAPMKLMAADADPSFEVATIKPNNSGATSMRGLTLNGRDFKTVASSLEDLIGFAYDVQAKQIVGAPEWADKDRYDLAAVPDVEGVPNAAQLRVMMRKLLAERFGLTFHKEKRELPAFVLTVAKGGERLKATELSGPLPGMGIAPAPTGLMLLIRNGKVGDLASFLQMQVLDRPVVDQTGLTGKYDMTVTFTPDDSEFHGHAPVPPKAEGVEAAPSLFEAMQQQLGLKLEAEKTDVAVIVVDKAQKPTGN